MPNGCFTGDARCPWLRIRWHLGTNGDRFRRVMLTMY